jgi:hypothetical protein
MEEAVIRLILLELTTESTLYNPVLDKKKYQLFETLGLDSRKARTWVKNKRYKLKVERDTNYPKFKATCDEARVPCPSNNNWLKALQPEEFDLDDLPDLPEEFEQEAEIMSPSMSSPLPSNRMTSPLLSNNTTLVVSRPHHHVNSKFYLLLESYFVCNHFSFIRLQLQTAMDWIAFNLLLIVFIKHIPVMVAYT